MGSAALTDLDECVGKVIMARRQVLGLSRAVFANRLGIAEARLGHIELGIYRPSPKLLLDISEVLQVKISYLFKDVDVGIPIVQRQEGDFSAYRSKSS